MDKPGEQQDAQAIEAALPDTKVTIEEVPSPSGETVEVAVIEGEEPQRPHDEMELGYKLGRMETRLVELEKQNAALSAQLLAFEQATVAAVTQEAAEIEQQSEVVAAVAEEVLPEGHEAATAHNPEHGTHKGSFWERLLGGHRHG